MDLTPSQRDAIETRGGNLLVSASAGSGKTEVLTRRVVSLLSDLPNPCTIERVLVLTFTKAAAAELRLRIAQMLRTESEVCGDERLRAHLRLQGLLLDAADIGTIDAWCGRIVREHFDAANIDPAFRILNDEESALFRRDVLEGLMTALFARTHPLSAAAYDWIARHRPPHAQFLRAMVERLNRFRANLSDPDAWFAAVRTAHDADDEALRMDAERRLATAVRTDLRTQVVQVDALLERRPDRWVSVYAQQLRVWEQLLAEGTSLEQVLADIHEYSFAPRGQLTDTAREVKDGWYKRYLRTRWDVGRVRDAIEDGPETAAFTRFLLALERDYQERLEAAKRRAGAYEFADILFRALRLVQTPDNDVVERLRRRYDHILVDEYQDTSPLQVALLEAVTRSSPGNRFMVGDVKQSIYGFREADARLFTALAESLRAGRRDGRLLPLADNFRSHPDVLAVVNALFETLFSLPFGGSDYGPDERLTARRAEPDNASLRNTARVVLRVLEPDDGAGDDRALERIEHEAVWTAREIKRLLERGTQVPQRNPDGSTSLRPLVPDDITILLRAARGNAFNVAGILRDAGIACSINGRESLFEYVEVIDVRNVLALLANRYDAIALAAVLRGPAIRLASAELLAIRHSAPQASLWDALGHFCRLHPNDPLTGRLLRLTAQLRRWRQAARHRELADVLRQIVRESGILAHARGLRRGVQRVAAIQALVSTAVDFGRRPGASLASFVAYLDDLTEQNLAADTPIAAVPDSVRIMTIHAAKGLEFPVVFVLNAGAAFNKRSSNEALQLDTEDGLGVRFDNRERCRKQTSAIHFVVRRQVRLRECEENLRLLYVATTRARELLYVVGTVDARRSQRWGAALVVQGRPLPIDLVGATCMLEWLLRAHAALGHDDVNGALRVEFDTTEAETDRAPRPDVRPAVGDAPPTAAADRSDATRSGPLTTADRSWVARVEARLLARLDPSASQLPAVMSVSALKARALEDADAPATLGPGADVLGTPTFISEQTVDGRTIGTNVHRYLEHVAPVAFRATDGVVAERDRLLAAGVLDPQGAALLPLEDLQWLAASEVGEMLATFESGLRREVPFVYSIPHETSADVQLLRGVIDVLITTEQDVILIDYKTDRPTSESDFERRRSAYTVQMKAYALAAGRILQRPVRRAILCFTARRAIADVPPITSLEELLGLERSLESL